MKLATARKILEHYLGKENVRVDGRQLTAHACGKVFSAYITGSLAGQPITKDSTLDSLHVRREDDHSDSHSDYFAGSFYGSMTRVVNAFLSRECLLSFEAPGEHGPDYFRLKFIVRMEGSGLKMKPVIYVDADLRFCKLDMPLPHARKEGAKYHPHWPQAGSFRGSIKDETLTNLIDKYVAEKDDATRNIIMDRVSEVLPDAHALLEWFNQKNLAEI